MSDTPWYDDISVMVNHCHDLKSLSALCLARSEGSRVNGERKSILNEFVVGGKWYLDKFGQVQSIENILKDFQDVPTTDLPVFPVIVSFSDFISLIEKHFKPRIEIRTNFGKPTPMQIGRGNVCKHCYNPLTLDDIPTLHSEERINITSEQIYHLIGGDFSNYSIKELTDQLTHILKAEILLHFKNNQDNRDPESKCGDRVEEVAYWTYSHQECHIDALNKRSRQQFTDALTETDITVYGSIRINNEYGPEKYYGSWFIFDTSLGLLTIGWRKRVINIDYSQIDPNYVADTEETKGPGFEHVWSYDKLTEALVKFKEHHHKLSQK